MFESRIGSSALTSVWLLGGVILLFAIVLLLLQGFGKLSVRGVELILAGVAVMAIIVLIVVLVLKGGRRRFEP